MRLDIGRLLMVLIGFLVAQVLIQYFLALLGFSGVAFVVAYNLLLSFVAVLIYYPSGYRKDAFRNPEFYRDVSIFFLIFLVLALLGF
jgi:amino acid transporter